MEAAERLMEMGMSVMIFFSALSLLFYGVGEYDKACHQLMLSSDRQFVVMAEEK